MRRIAKKCKDIFCNRKLNLQKLVPKNVFTIFYFFCYCIRYKKNVQWIKISKKLSTFFIIKSRNWPVGYYSTRICIVKIFGRKCDIDKAIDRSRNCRSQWGLLVTCVTRFVPILWYTCTSTNWGWFYLGSMAWNWCRLKRHFLNGKLNFWGFVRCTEWDIYTEWEMFNQWNLKELKKKEANWEVS